MAGRPTCEAGTNHPIQLNRRHPAGLWVHHLHPTALQTVKQHFQQIPFAQQVLQLFLKLSNCQINCHDLLGASHAPQDQAVVCFLALSLLINQKTSGQPPPGNEKRSGVISCQIGTIYSIPLQHL